MSLQRISRLHSTSVLILAVAVMGGCRNEKPSTSEILKSLSAENRQRLQPMQSTPLIVEGVESPQLVDSTQISRSLSDEVIGVVVAGEPRAYFVDELSGMLDHVVNDVASTSVGRSFPFTVTYCDQTNCVRVLRLTNFSGEESTGIGTLGMLEGGLALRWNGKQFKQMDAVEGLQDLPYERTTWGEWLIKHPTTKAYLGDSVRARKDTAWPHNTPQ